MKSLNPKPKPQEPRPEKADIPPKLKAAARAALAEGQAWAIKQPRVELQTFALLTVGEAITHLAQQRNEELLRVGAMGIPPGAAIDHANAAWRESLPELVDKHSVLIYLAAVAWGMRNRLLKPDEAKLMIFLAQTQLTVFKMDIPGPLQAGALRAPEVPTAQLTLLPDRAAESEAPSAE